MNSQLVRNNAILPFAAYQGADFSGKEGYPVELAADGTIKMLASPTTDDGPFGVIVAGKPSPEKSSVAILNGGLAGTIRLKILEDVTTIGGWLRLRQVGGEIAFGPNPGPGTERVLCATALETGAAGELIEAVIFCPLWLS